MRSKPNYEVLRLGAGDHQLAVWYHFLLKAKAQLTEESLEVLAATNNLLAHHAFTGLSQNLVRKKQLVHFSTRPQSSPVVRGCEGCSRAAYKIARGYDWSSFGTMVAGDRED
jgi:hypothetical protein